MAEFGGFAREHRQSLTTLLGTQTGTILGPVPPQQNYEIVEVVVTPYGTVGGPTVTGRLMQFATISGYSQYGTTLGTVVEPFAAAPGSAFVDGNGDAPIAYVNPGNLLLGIVDGAAAGSVLCKVVYRPINKRGW
jgi:hypothetical protein